MSEQQERTPITSYFDLSSQMYTLFVNAFASAARRAVANSRAVYDIVSRPYSSMAIGSIYAENLERANRIVELATNELQTRGTNAAKLAEQVAAYGAQLQELQTQILRDLTKAGISSLEAARDTQSQRLSEFAKQVEEVQRLNQLQVRAAAAHSHPPNSVVEAVQGEAHFSPGVESANG
jgi:hypothetical protein